MVRGVKDCGLAEIRAGECYPLAVFMEKVGLAQWTLRRCRKSGLKMIKIGTRKFVRGEDWLDFLAKEAERQEAST